MKSLNFYHGSTTSGIEILEPHRPRNGAFQDRTEISAVYATTDIDYAIFMAVIGSRKWGGCNSEKFGDKGFYLYEEFSDYLDPTKYEEPIGTVYDLNPDSFELSRYNEWHSKSPVKVLGSFAVGLRDLPKIAVIPELHPSHYRQ